MALVNIQLVRKDKQTSNVRLLLSGLAPEGKQDKKLYKRVAMTVGSIPTKEWDGAAQRPKLSFSKKDSGTLHRDIDLAVSNLLTAYNDAQFKTASHVK
ncbi:MAG TPA: hypothetical protein VHL57_05015, partial [Flavobacteriales bacterium]|nr:hypothetical protein [Flavobacteriales bacterium]